MDEKDLQQITDLVGKAVGTAVAPLTAKIDEVGKDAKEAKETALAVKGEHEKVAREVLRVDAEGRTVRLGPDGTIVPFRRSGAAPAYVRAAALGDKPYSTANLIRALMEKDEKFAPLEIHVSATLEALHFPRNDQGRSYLVPLSSTEDYLPASLGKDAEPLRMLLKDALPEARFDAAEMLDLGRKAFGSEGHEWVERAKALDPNDDTAGGVFVPYPTRGELIELLRKATIMGQVGCQQVAIPPGGLDYPKETGGTTFQRTTPNVGPAESQPSTGSVRLLPKELSGIVKIPNSLIRWSNPAVEGVVRRALSLDAALAADLDYLLGTGGTAVPLGLLRYPFSANDTPTRDKITLHNAATVAANGNTFGAADPGLMMSLVEEAPDPQGPTAFIMYPRMFWVLANKRADAASAGDVAGPFMFPMTRGAMGEGVAKNLLGVPVATSTQVPRNRTKGSGTTLTAIVLGNFRRAVIGRVGALEIALSTDAGFAANQTWLRATMYDDFALLNPEAFVVSDQLLIA